MEMLLARNVEQKSRTLGRLYLNAFFECFTVEDVVRRDDPSTPANEGAKVDGETAIPAGTYPVVLQDSPKFGPDTLTLLNVPGFDYIRMHSGNTEKDTEGCLVVGSTRTETGVGDSRAALKALKAKVVPQLKAGERCSIRVVDVPR